MQARRRSGARTETGAVIAMLKAWASENQVGEGSERAPPKVWSRVRRRAGAVDAKAIVALLGERRAGHSDAPSALLMV
jgi:hypothetical protein